MAFFVLMPAVASSERLARCRIERREKPTIRRLFTSTEGPMQSAALHLNAYAEQARLKAVELVKSKIDATIDVGSVKHDVDMPSRFGLVKMAASGRCALTNRRVTRPLTR